MILQMENDYKLAKEQIDEAEEQSRELAHDIQSVELRFLLNRESDSSRDELTGAEQLCKNGKRWDDFNGEFKTAQTAQVEKRAFNI